MVRCIFALLLAVALTTQAAPNPRLAALQIEIWPEYDRPGALVILKAEIATDAALPAQVSLRIPAVTGGPSAVAYADASEKLVNLPYEREPAGQFVTLRMRPPERYLHIEFYDPLDASKAERQYLYTWPGDMAVERVSVLVKEPAGSGNLAVQPTLDIRSQSPDGLAHRAAALGALKAGQSLPIEIRYTKSDPRPSTEILGAAAPAAGPPAQPAAPRPAWPLILIAAGVAGLLVAAGAFLWRGRRVEPSGRFCSQCGKPTKAGDRFCPSCGKPQK